ncbi:MAG: GIY-YIG nuclease family protein [Saprospiraceae bacterium]|nr:GIY-YIG nuclease family protein [Saprospiraceae bacterium]
MSSKKELKEAYKQMKTPKGVFQIRNTSNGKIFVEGSLNLKAIWNRYQLQLEMGSHPSPSLQADYRAFGPDCFVFEILAELDEENDDRKDVDWAKELKLLEALYLEELQPFEEKGYNRKPKNL